MADKLSSIEAFRQYAGVRALLLAAFPEQTRQQTPPNPFIVAVTIDGIIVDFLLTLPGYEELIIERAVRRGLDVFCLDLFAGGFNHSKSYSRRR